jgi:hypothetical protein
MAHELKSKLELVIHGDKSLNLNLDGKLMNINYDKSAVYEETGENLISLNCLSMTLEILELAILNYKKYKISNIALNLTALN